MRISDWSSDVCSSDLLVGGLGRWRPVLPERTLPRERIGDAMAAGVRYVAMSPHILVVLVRSTLFGVGSIVIQALLPLVARDLVGGGSFTYGVLLGAFGIGAVGGAGGRGVLPTRRPTEGGGGVAGLASR